MPRLPSSLKPLWPLLALLALTAEQPGRGLDLIVYGGTPQGIAAAATAASRGLSVLLVEPGPQLGGVLTQGWLATLDASLDGRGRLLGSGSLVRLLRGLEYDPSFDVGQAQQVLDGLARQGRLTVWRNTRLESLDERGGWLRALHLSRGGQRWTLTPRAVIDASDRADLAARAGALFSVGRSDGGLDGRQMAATLVFRVSGVAWRDVERRILAERGRAHGFSDVHGRSANGMWDLAAGYRASDPARFRLRGLNLARQDDGSLLVNALLIAGVDGTDPASERRARQDGAREAARVVAYLRAADPATFGGARLAGVAPELYLRETRHLIALRRLHADAVFAGEAVPDPVAVGGYPLDGQLYDARESTYLLGRPRPYPVGFGSLIPWGFRNLLVVSQAAGFDSAAAFSARVVPLQMVLGDAAAHATWVALARGVDFPTLDAHYPWLRAALPRLPETGGERRAEADSDEQAAWLLRRGLMNLPYYLQGRYDLGGPVTAPEVLSDLEHLLYARGPSPQQVALLASLRPLARRAAERPMRAEELRDWLTALDLPAPDLPDGGLDRATLVQVLGALADGDRRLPETGRP